MGLEQVEQGISELIIKALSATSLSSRLKSLGELEMMTQMAKIEMRVEMREMEERMDKTIKERRLKIDRYREKINHLKSRLLK